MAKSNRWEVLRDEILPELIGPKRRVKVWSAACSTGEEPYTLAMILDTMGILKDSSITASDLDEGALAKAKEGRYMERSLKDVPKETASRYFKQDGLVYRIDDKLKSSIKFMKQNLLLDPFDDGYDLIVCRNVMIYFTEEAKNLLYHKFAASLRPGGILFVGSTEQIFSLDNTVWRQRRRSSIVKINKVNGMANRLDYTNMCPDGYLYFRVKKSVISAANCVSTSRPKIRFWAGNDGLSCQSGSAIL